jgi:hypothetical protein
MIMKRLKYLVVFSVIIFTIFSTNLISYAATTTTDTSIIKSIDFNDIEATMKLKNPTIIANNETLNDLYNSLLTAGDNTSILVLNAAKSTIQTSMSNDQAVYSAQNLYLSYNDLDDQISTIDDSLSQLNSQLKLAQLKYNLGLISSKDIKSIQANIKNVTSNKESLLDQKEKIKKQINDLFDQPEDTDVSIGAYPEFNISDMFPISVEDDYENCVENSYSVRLQNESYVENANDAQYNKLNNEKSNYKETLQNAYDDIMDKYDAYMTENDNLTDEQDNYNLMQLKYNLGIESKMDLDNENVILSNEKIKVETARKTLYKSYLKYQWIKRGLSL